MSDRIQDILRREGVSDALMPSWLVRQMRASALVIDDHGDIVPNKAAPFRTPLTMHWYGSAGKQRAARAGTAILLAAHAATPPSSADCIVGLTQQTEGSGTTTIATVRIQRYGVMADEEVNEAILAGSWLGMTVIQSGGASGVSLSLTMRLG
jgi:hypothetical protein